MTITLNLTDQAAEDYASFYGYAKNVQGADGQEVANPVTVEKFVTDKLLEKITNDLTEKRNRDAVNAVQDTPVVVTE